VVVVRRRLGKALQMYPQVSGGSTYSLLLRKPMAMKTWPLESWRRDGGGACAASVPSSSTVPFLHQNLLWPTWKKFVRQCVVAPHQLYDDQDMFVW